MDPLAIFLTSLLAATAVGLLRSADPLGRTSAPHHGEAQINEPAFGVSEHGPRAPARPRAGEASTERAA